MTTFLIILGAVTFSAAAVYGVLRLGAWCDGRPWKTQPDPARAEWLEMQRRLWDYYSVPED